MCARPQTVTASDNRHTSFGVRRRVLAVLARGPGRRVGSATIRARVTVSGTRCTDEQCTKQRRFA
ncbi:hypothetical protein RHRU231_870005 [Rhodococcus ruber]|uniref:Uncharacterized protein n=1 Tax=Rhodococcus ruber TaxID=1830 RepID=A0A098BVK0_9NOCA|nr:hypothetical protein RHRU231_870005 [Rhodococcus ruber]